MDEEKKRELNKAIAVMRDYCKNITSCKDCELDNARICGWATPPYTWPDID